MNRTVDGLRGDERAMALMEFALTAPLLLTVGAYGIELANYAIIQQRVSSIALQLADNGSRVGVDDGQAEYQLREGDINDVLQGARSMGTSLGLTTHGRVTMSSLENVTQKWDSNGPVQRIHWQRCIGLHKGYDSTYSIKFHPQDAGKDPTQDDEGDKSTGMGNPVVVAPDGSGVIFVEISYEYQPIFGTMFMSPNKIYYTASYMVRDKRDFSHIYNPPMPQGTPAPVASTCDLYTA